MHVCLVFLLPAVAAAACEPLYRNGAPTHRYGMPLHDLSSSIIARHCDMFSTTKASAGIAEMRSDFANRLDDPEETQENAEFLPSADGKKTTRFTDVWTHG